MPHAISVGLLGVLFILAGINHFVHPAFYLAMMPPYLPWHNELVQLSGVAEIVGGMAILFSPLRWLAGWGLIALLVAVFPANLHAAFYGIAGSQIAPWLLWTRLPVQGLLIAAVYLACVKPAWSRTLPAR